MARPPARDGGSARRQPSGRGRKGAQSSDAGSGRLSVPGHDGEPIGRDRATRSRNAPPRPQRPTQEPAPERPALPDEEPMLPRAVRKEIDRVLGPGPRARDVALCLSIASQALEEERPDVALEVLVWARHQAPRLALVREAYGVALYQAERWADALAELQGYRRLSGRTDQNHLIADSLRALGRGIEQVADAAEPLVTDPQAPEDRRAEAAIVWAAALADAGDLGAGRAVLRRFLERPRSGDAEHDLRVRYVAADLAERAGDRDEARRQLELIAAVADDFLDVPERLEAVTDA
jgi:tetratricopeptide (TPR) repeat protein